MSSIFSVLFVDGADGNNFKTGLYCTEVRRFEQQM
jgi:hypothetical protein